MCYFFFSFSFSSTKGLCETADSAPNLGWYWKDNNLPINYLVPHAKFSTKTRRQMLQIEALQPDRFYRLALQSYMDDSWAAAIP